MRFVLLAIQMAFVTLPLRGDEALGRWVSLASAASLRAGGTVLQSIPPDGGLSLLPPVSSRALIDSEVRSFRPSVGIEIMHLIGPQKSPFSAPSDWLRLFNTLHAASTMQGTRYWSVSRGREEVLFSQSYAVSSPSSPRRVADPSFNEIPLESLFYTLQEDRSFGKNVYAESFSFPGDHLSVKIENLTTISLLLVPIVQPSGFVVRLVLVPAGSSILFYGVAVLRTALPIGDRHSREESLANRLVAMADWLQKELASPP